MSSKQVQAGRERPSRLVALSHARASGSHAFMNRKRRWCLRFESTGARLSVVSRITPRHRALRFSKTRCETRHWQIQTLTRRLSIKLLVPVLGDRGLLAHGAHLAPARGGVHLRLTSSQAEVCWSQGTQGRCRPVLNLEGYTLLNTFCPSHYHISHIWYISVPHPQSKDARTPSRHDRLPGYPRTFVYHSYTQGRDMVRISIAQ